MGFTLKSESLSKAREKLPEWGLTHVLLTCLLVSSGAATKYHGRGGSNNRNWLLTVLEVGESEIKMQMVGSPV